MALKGELAAYEPKPVTLPAFQFKKADSQAVERELADHRTQIRAVKAGLEAWRSLKTANRFEAWCAIGQALLVGKTYSLRVTGSNCAWGAAYSREFSNWMKQHGFGAMRCDHLGVAIELVENIESITQWRDALSEGKRQRLNSAQAIVKRWRLSVAGKQREFDLTKAALTAWHRFCACANALPPDQAIPLWQQVHAQAAAHVNA